MARYMRQYDKEYMKMAMLNQEQTFREQVNELHRLYRVQKLLMGDVTRAAAAVGLQTPRDHHHRRMRPPLDLEVPPDNDASAGEEDAHVQLTLATGSGNGWRSAAAKNAETSDSGSASAVSFSSSASTDSGSAGESLHVRDWGLWYRATGPVDQPPGQVAVAVRQGRPEQRPSWQLQYLSLNMT